MSFAHNPDVNPLWTPKVAQRVYECADCGNQQVLQTNHTGSTFATRCTGKCRYVTAPHTPREMVSPAYTRHNYVKEVE